MGLTPSASILLVGALNGALLALLLLRQRHNRLAGRLLAALVLLVALRLMPYVLGYAGLYDRHRWLTFAPFDLSLAAGPLLWGYLVALTTGEAPPRFATHFLPAAVQLTYQLTCFALPIELKWSWYTGVHLHTVEPVGFAFVLVSLGIYLFAARNQLTRYRRWLFDELSTVEPYRLEWLRIILLACFTTLLFGLAYAAVSWTIAPLDYFQRFPMMLVLAALAYLVGALGWRHAATPYPYMPLERSSAVRDLAPSLASHPENVEQKTAERSIYAVQAEQWSAVVREREWWRDDTLTLATLSSKLGTSPRTLSRVLGEGNGVTFHAFINRMRVEAVARQLSSGETSSDIIAIAFDAGFNSKATFNRVFKQFLGVTPSEFRARALADHVREPVD